MPQIFINAQNTETNTLCAGLPGLEQNTQDWNQYKSADLIQNDGFSLNDEHWTVIDDRCDTYSDYGLPKFVRTKIRTLDHHLSDDPFRGTADFLASKRAEEAGVVVKQKMSTGAHFRRNLNVNSER